MMLPRSWLIPGKWRWRVWLPARRVYLVRKVRVGGGRWGSLEVVSWEAVFSWAMRVSLSFLLDLCGWVKR